MVSRNPFRVRTSEYLEDDSEFLSLFGLEALDIFDSEDMWTRIQIIRSARGGGKTSILRIFTPKSLNEIYESRSTTDEISLLYKKLKSFDVFSDSFGTKVLGVTLSLFGNYPILNQLDFDESKQNRLFFSLLTSRIILATLRSICELKKLEFPNDLDKINIKHPAEPNIPTAIPIPCDGKELYDWASSIEQKVSNIIEDDSDDDKNLSGYETLSSLHVIRSKNIFYKDKPIAEKTLLMLDDVDKLTPVQRKNLSDTLANLRIPIGVWLAERLEALRPDELLSPIGTLGREYGEPKLLEKFWRQNPRKFEHLLTEISDKRATWHRSYNISSFKRLLSNNLDEIWDEDFKLAIKTESDKLIKKHSKKRKYINWFDRCENPESNLSKTAEDWRLLEILIERDIRKKQHLIFENEALPEDDFTDKLSTKEKDVSEYYIRIKYKIPYYFGFEKLVNLASSNIQQFLDLSSDLFDEMITSRSFDTVPHISAKRQEQILKKAIFRRWNEIIQSIPNSKVLINFLDNVAKFCFTETNLPNSPYASVTGIAISSEDVKRLQDDNILKNNPRYKILSDILSTCFAQNLLEPLPSTKQGTRGTTHLVMYLNRLLCFRYQLPLPYVGWREQSLETLCTFFEGTYKSKRTEHVDLSQTLGELRDK